MDMKKTIINYILFLDSRMVGSRQTNLHNRMDPDFDDAKDS